VYGISSRIKAHPDLRLPDFRACFTLVYYTANRWTQGAFPLNVLRLWRHVARLPVLPLPCPAPVRFLR